LLTLDPEPRLVVGGTSAELSAHFFSRAQAALVAGDGGLVVLDGLGMRVSRLRPDGTPMWTVGGVGDAPGEYRSFAWHVVSDSTVSVVDDRAGRITILASDDGRVLETRSTAIEVGPQLPAVVAFDDDGDQLVRRRTFTVDFDPRHELVLFRDSFELVLVRPDGSQTSVGRSVSKERFMWFDGVNLIQDDAPLSSGTWLDRGSRPDRVLAADGDEGWATVFSTEGKIQRVDLRLPSLAVSSERLKSFRQSDLDGRSSAEIVEARRAVWGAMHVPDALPLFEELVLDSDDRVWARLPSPDGPATWVIRGLDGAALGRLLLPSDRTILDATGHLVALHHKDELDAELIEVYSFSGGS
jgi:hypothetical protein